MLIAVDGLDGCGKSAHADNIRRLLESQGEKVTVLPHPSGRLFGRLSKRFLQDTGAGARLFATLFFTLDVLASVRWYRKQKSGNVIFVRYLLGSAYLPGSLAPIGYRIFRNLLPFPDIALFIDIEPEVAIRRIAIRGHTLEMFETREKLTATRRVATSLVSEEWVTIDNSEDGEGPFGEVETVLRARSVLRPAVGP